MRFRIPVPPARLLVLVAICCCIAEARAASKDIEALVALGYKADEILAEAKGMQRYLSQPHAVS